MTGAGSDALGVLFAVVEILEGQGIPYHLGGSYASSVHGLPRQTHDIDLVIELEPHRIAPFVAAFASGYYIDAEQVTRAVREKRSCNLVHLDTGLKVDLFIRGDSAFDRSEFDRRVETSFGTDPPRRLYVKSAEDTILRKLLWYRSGGEVSDRQWSDILGIVRHQGNRLDRRYLAEWAERLSLVDLLDRALASR